MSSSKPLIDTRKVTSFESITIQLTELKKVLNTTALPQLQLFNSAYLEVTNEIKRTATNNHFDNPEFIEKFTVCFSCYYFDAVNKLAAKSKDLPPAWKSLNQASLNRHMPKFIFLMMGANAHINNDLPLALVELMSKEKSEDLLRDVIKLDKILMQSGRKIIGLFDESNKLLNFLKRRFIFLYYRPAMYTILYWRVKAWHDYRIIKEQGLENNYQKRSIRIASRIMRIGHILGPDKTRT